MSKQKEIDSGIANRIVECREKCKYTQQDMEERTGLSVNTISSAENCGDFKVSTLLLMVNAFREKLGEEIEGEKIGAYILYGKNEEKTKRAEQKKTNLERFAELPVELQDKLLAVVETMNSLK